MRFLSRLFFCASRGRNTCGALVTAVQTCDLPIAGMGLPVWSPVESTTRGWQALFRRFLKRFKKTQEVRGVSRPRRPEAPPPTASPHWAQSSAARRVGKECVRRSRLRWLPYHETQKNNKYKLQS